MAPRGGVRSASDAVAGRSGIAWRVDHRRGAGRPASGHAGGIRDDDRTRTTAQLPRRDQARRRVVSGSLPRADVDRVYPGPEGVPRLVPATRPDLLRITRGELELYVRSLEGRRYATATIARRFGTVATFYKCAVIDGVIRANPADAVSRPRVAWEGKKRTVLHPLEFAALLSAARTSSPNDHALVCLLGMLGLRVSEACAADMADIRYDAGYELLHVLGKGAKPADIPLPIPVLRAAHEAIAGRTSGPILRTRTGRRMDRAGASRALTRGARAAGISHQISPHGLRRTFCTTGLVAGIALRDMQYAMRHADPPDHAPV